MRTRPVDVVLALLVVAAALFGVRGEHGRAQGEVPSNDGLANARAIAFTLSPPFGGHEEFASTAGATVEPGEPICVPGGGATIWFLFSAPTTGEVLIEVQGSGFVPFISVFGAGASAPSYDSLEEIGCAVASGERGVGPEPTPTPPPSSDPAELGQLRFDASSGERYAIQIGGRDSGSGPVRVRIGCVSGSCPPANDPVVVPTHLFRLPHLEVIDTSLATIEPNEPRPCAGIGKTVWYWHETFSDNYTTTVAVNAEGFTPVIALYNVDFSQPSPPHGLVNVACVTGTSAGDASHTFETNQFTQYWVQVGGVDATGGRAQVEFTCTRANGTPCVFDVEGPENPSPGSGVATPGSGLVAGPDTGSGGHKAPRGR